MYVPDHFALSSLSLQHEVIRAHSFGLLTTAGEGAPVASHLPFELDADAGEFGALRGHFSRSNPHAAVLDRPVEALVVFAGPHAYVSPNSYPPGPRVPTWNYVTVHAVGTPRRIEAGPALEALLGRMVLQFEGADGWSEREQDSAYLEKMRGGVIGFEMPIVRIEGKAKLGQNHSRSHRAGAIEGLRTAGGEANEAVADWMQRQLEGELG